MVLMCASFAEGILRWVSKALVLCGRLVLHNGLVLRNGGLVLCSDGLVLRGLLCLVLCSFLCIGGQRCTPGYADGGQGVWKVVLGRSGTNGARALQQRLPVGVDALETVVRELQHRFLGGVLVTVRNKASEPGLIAYGTDSIAHAVRDLRELHAEEKRDMMYQYCNGNGARGFVQRGVLQHV